MLLLCHAVLSIGVLLLGMVLGVLVWVVLQEVVLVIEAASY